MESSGKTTEKIKEKVKAVKKAIIEVSDRELSRLEKLLNILRGKVSSKFRIKLLLDPDNVLTSTKLTPSERDFIALCNFLPKRFPHSGFGGLKKYADLHCLTSISLGGWGVENAIRYEGAVSESKLMAKMGFFKSDQTAKGTNE